MKKNVARFTLMMMLPVFAAFAATEPDPYREEIRAGAEEIYVFRTTRTQSERGATPACSAAPFVSVREDHYDLWSVSLGAGDGRVTNTHRKRVGEFRACFSELVAGHPLSMFAVGTIARVSWTAVGECTLMQSSPPPVRTLLPFNCQLNVGGLPSGYAGGFVVSSTLAPALGRNAAPDAHVRGYLSTSVVTMRLWRATQSP